MFHALGTNSSFLSFTSNWFSLNHFCCSYNSHKRCLHWKQKKICLVSLSSLQRLALMLFILTKKDHLYLFSSLLFSSTNKTKSIIHLSQTFSIEWYQFSKLWFCLKWDFSRSQSSKRTTFLRLPV
jgi:hypothetical protein